MGIKFNRPETFVKDKASGHYVVDRDNSEEFRLFENDFLPNKVFYAVKANRYYKDNECTKVYSADELELLGLPSTAEIANAREKLQKKYADAGKIVPMLQIQRETSPKELPIPADIQAKLVDVSPLQRKINKLNATTLRK